MIFFNLTLSSPLPIKTWFLLNLLCSIITTAQTSLTLKIMISVTIKQWKQLLQEDDGVIGDFKIFIQGMNYYTTNSMDMNLSKLWEIVKDRQPTLVFLPGKIPGVEEPGMLQFMGSQRVRHDWATSLSFTFFEDSLAVSFCGIEMKTDLFLFCGHCWVFLICRHIGCSTSTASSFRIWKSSAGIPSPPLALFVMMLPKAYLPSHSRMFGLRWVTTPSWLSESFRYFCTVLLCILATSFFNIFCFC